MKNVSWLDFKLGLRMLARYPGLTLVGTVAMAVAIALGSLYFEGVNKFFNPRLPIPDADRVVSIRIFDASEFEMEGRSLHDYAIMREQLKTVEDLGVAISFVRNLVTDDRRVEPVSGAEVTANAFKLIGTRPLLGRTLTEQDEKASDPVVVIGHSVWKTRFESDPGVVGRTLKLGTVTATRKRRPSSTRSVHGSRPLHRRSTRTCGLESPITPSRSLMLAKAASCGRCSTS